MSVEEESMQMATSYLRALLRATRSLVQASREGMQMGAALYKFQRDVRIGRTGKKSFSGKYGLARNCRSLSFLVIPDQAGPNGELSAQATRSLMKDFEKDLKQCGVSFAYTNKSFAPDGIATTIAIDGDQMETVMAIIQQEKYKNAGIDFANHLSRENFDSKHVTAEDQKQAQETFQNGKSKGGMSELERTGKEGAVNRETGHDLFDAKQYEPTAGQKKYLEDLMSQRQWGPDHNQRFDKDQIDDWLNNISEADASAMLAELGAGESIWGTRPPDNFRADSPIAGPSPAQRMNTFKKQSERRDPTPGGGTERFSDCVERAGKNMAKNVGKTVTRGKNAPTLGDR